MFPAKSLQCTRLSNGVLLLTESLPDFQSIAVGLWVRCGSCYEQASASGLSHFLEHATFKGTRRRTAEQISLEADFIGADLNAIADREHTCYYLKVLPENLRLGLDLLCDVVLHPLFDPIELEREKQVVLQEIRQAEDQPADLVGDLLTQTMFPGQALGRRVLGDREVIGELTEEQVSQFYHTFYRPEAMLITASGNLQHKQMVEVIGEFFEGREFHSGPFPILSDPPTYHAGVARQHKEIEQVNLCLGLPGLTQRDPDKYALSLLEVALGGGPSSRLFQEVREKRGLAYIISSFCIFLAEAGIFGVHVGTSPEYVDEILDITRAQLQSLKERGLEESELEKAKNQVRGALLMSLETPSARMTAMGRCMLYLDRVLSTQEILAEIESVTREETCGVAQGIFREEAEVLAMVGPFGTSEN